MLSWYVIIFLSIHIFLEIRYFSFEVENKGMILHFTETDEITTGTINNLEKVNALRARQLRLVSWRLWLLLQYNIVSNSKNHHIFLRTTSHKLDFKDQILYFSTYARWSGFAVWLELLILFVYLFDFLKHTGFLPFENEFHQVSVLSCLEVAWHTSMPNHKVVFWYMKKMVIFGHDLSKAGEK